MWKFKKIGYVSIELVLMAAIVMTSGLVGLSTLNVKGSDAMASGMNKLAALGIFGDTPTGGGGPAFSTLWYDSGLNVQAEDVNPVSDFVYVLNDNETTYTISGYNNVEDKTVVIPKFHNDGKTITAIGDYAFQDISLTSVALHNAIDTVGAYAFEGNELTSIYFADYAVASRATRGIVYTSGEAGSGLTLEQYAFANNKITEVKLANGLVEIGNSAFENNELQTITIPNTTTKLGDKAFFSNNITEIVLPPSIDSIGNYAFKDNSLGAITFEGNLPTVLGTDIFGLNTGLTLRTVEVPSGQLNTFKAAASLLGVQTYALYDPAIPHDPKVYDGTWYDASLGVSEADINPVSNFTFTFNSTTSTYSISGYTNATDKSVVIPKFHTDGNVIDGINAYAFQNKALTSLILHNGLKTIGDCAFWTNRIASVIIPDSVVTIKEGAFWTNKLATVKIGSGVVSIGNYGFSGNNLTSISIPSGVSELGAQAFSANKLVSVTFMGAAPTTSGASIFLNNLTLGNGSVLVPSAHLAAYQANTSKWSLTQSHLAGY